MHNILAMGASEGARMRKRLAWVAELDTLGAPRAEGYRSTSSWLSAQVGLDARTARDWVRIAHRLQEWTRVRDALGEGRLSYSKCRALSRASVHENEAELLQIALEKTVISLEEHVRQLRSARSADLETAEQARKARYVRFGEWRENGLVPFYGMLDPVGGRLLQEAIDTLAAQIHAEPGQPRPSIDERRAEALTRILRGAIPKTSLVLHADLAALAADDGGAICHLEHGPAIPSELARRLTCDAMVTTAGLNHGRELRLATAAQHRALRARDGAKCWWTGCDCTHGLDAHHIRHWLLGGRTDLDNLVLLCPFHHRLVHEGGWTMQPRRDRIIIRNDKRQVVDERQRPPKPRRRHHRRSRDDCPQWTIVVDHPRVTRELKVSSGGSRLTT
ncbi:MAG: hypothetical protein QOJ81_1793 [Chloroflexota bacterium]|nr:hypothetical protein [Chloroflexota bacterium]